MKETAEAEGLQGLHGRAYLLHVGFALFLLYETLFPYPGDFEDELSFEALLLQMVLLVLAYVFWPSIAIFYSIKARPRRMSLVGMAYSVFVLVCLFAAERLEVLSLPTLRKAMLYSYVFAAFLLGAKWMFFNDETGAKASPGISVKLSSRPKTDG